MPRLSPCLLLLALSPAPADTPGADDWKYDVIHRKRGLPFKGLIVEQGAATVRIRCISRKPGSPTVVFPETVSRSDIERMDLLSREDRAVLEQRLDSLKREREVLAAQLRALDPGHKGSSPAETFDLRPAAWPGDDKVKALSYQSTHFRLVANTRRELAQLAAIHLEQVYAAYVRSLPPRAAGTPTTVLLTGSVKEYQALARSRGLNLFNPAFYEPERNQVVCGSDLERLGDELEKVRAHHVKLRASMKERRAELAKVYKGKVPGELLAPLNDAEKRIAVSEQRNDAGFTRVRERLFCRLY